MYTQTSQYRPDIDGLRAVAVLSVLVFHAFPSAMPGGFVGVDIFFVISGYLITSILVREALGDRLSILQFYIRRARRIFPALLAVLAVTLLLGWLMMFPVEWQPLGKHVAAGSVFVSNIALWRESGYFDVSSDFKPLLHLWSLAVEEQYYLVWPLILGLTARLGRRWLLGAALLIAVASFAFSVAMTPRQSVLAFYLPMSRFWELLAGSGLAILRSKALQGSRLNQPAGPLLAEAMGWLGLAAIVAAVAGFSRATPFPGYAAALPVLGSTFVIAAGPGARVNRWLLAHPATVWVGLISYPLYLWHWPLLAYVRIWFGEAAPAEWRLAMMAAAVLLAWLTYRFIESPIRADSRNHLARADAARLWTALLAFGAIGLAVWAGKVPARSAHSALVGGITAAQRDWVDANDQSWPGALPGRVLMVGDSHMQHYAPRLAKLLPANRGRAHPVTLISLSGCAPVPGITRQSTDCAAFTEKAYAAMQASDVQTVVLASSWKGFSIRPDYYRTGDSARQRVVPFAPDSQWVMDEWQQRLLALRQAGKRVVIVLSSPRGAAVEPQRLIERSLWAWSEQPIQPPSEASLKAVVQDVDAQVLKVAQAVGAEVVEPFAFFCKGGVCPVVDEQGAPIFIDDSHIRASYVKSRVDYLDRFFMAP